LMVKGAQFVAIPLFICISDSHLGRRRIDHDRHGA
jgi:hypothetical protein